MLSLYYDCHFLTIGKDNHSIENANFAHKTNSMNKDINRIKVVLAEKKRTNKWLAQELGKDPGTVSKWCTNTIQPNLETLVEIAKCLDVDTKDLLWSIK